MAMLRYIGLLLLIPLLDALLLVVAVPFLGWQLVVLLVVLTGLIGLLLARVQGRYTLRKIQRKAAAGEAPTNEVIDGGLLLVAGAFLLTPGLVTDFIGFLILVPVTRYPIRWGLKRWVIMPYLDQKTGGFASGEVYIGGFPDEGPSPEGGSPGPDAGDSEFDIDDATTVDFEDVDDGEGKSNA